MKPLLYPLLLASVLAALHAAPWPSWRGDLAGTGHTSETKLPLTWGPEKNVRWRSPLPERGNSTPVIHGDMVFVTQAVTKDHWRGLMCFDRKDGELRWKNGLTCKKAERTHEANPYCSASPTTDGKIVVAAYGSAGLAAYDMDGKQLWHRDLGPIEHPWGNSSSPLLVDDLVIHYHGPDKEPVLYGLDRKTGATRWQWKEPKWQPGKRTDGFRGREDKGILGSFSTPIIVDTAGRRELIMSFPMEMKAFDPSTGRELWSCAGLNPLVYTSPVHAEGVVIAMGGYQGNSIGVKTGGSGDVTRTHRLWHEIRHHGGIGNGVIHDGHYYNHNSGGVVFCDDIRTGQTIWKDRLPGAGKSWGSFLLSGDRIYTLSQAGDSVVFKASPDGLEVLARSDLDEETNSSPVASDGELFLRTHEALWCIGQ